MRNRSAIMNGTLVLRSTSPGSVAFQTVCQKLLNSFCATWTTYGYHGISHERQDVISNDMDQKIAKRNGEATIY